MPMENPPPGTFTGLRSGRVEPGDRAMRSEGVMQSRRYPLLAVSALFTLALSLLIAGPGEPDVPLSLPESDTPLGATSRLLASYRLERLDDYAALLLPGFRFVFGDPALKL